MDGVWLMVGIGVAVALIWVVVWWRDARRNNEVEHDSERLETGPEQRPAPYEDPVLGHQPEPEDDARGNPRRWR